MKRALVALLLLSGCGGVLGPEASSCRRYPTRIIENGIDEFECQLSAGRPTVLDCARAFRRRTWEYPTLEDFVGEADVANRFRRTRVFTSASSLGGGFASAEATYDYDSQGRLVGRVRRGFGGSTPIPLDTTRFTSWDSLGRPLSASIVRPNGEEQTVSILYDDSRREVAWSNGERHRVDRYGNTLVEGTAFGAGVVREYEILAMDEICLP